MQQLAFVGLTMFLVLAGCSGAQQAPRRVVNVTLPAKEPPLKDPIAESLLEKVVVKELGLGFSSGSADDRLIEEFSSKPYEQQFRVLSVKNWRATWDAFAYKLVVVAKQLQLSYAGLFLGLTAERSRLRSSTAQVPVGAFLSTFDGAPAWVVIYKWEMVGTDPRGKPLMLGHIKIDIMDAETGAVLTSISCD